MELTWFPYSLAATLLFGVAMAFYKLPSTKNHNRFVATFWSLVIPTILSFVFFHSYLSLGTPAMMWTALLWGITFTCIVLLQMYALSHVDTNVLFPITTTASLIITVLIGIFFFNEHISALQTFGVILAVVTIFSFLVLPVGIEPTSQAPQACVLSIERREPYRRSMIAEYCFFFKYMG